MESSKFTNLICLVRRIKVAPTPEEKIRQRLLFHMLGSLGYPREQLAVEKDFFSEGMSRRIDIVCFYRVEENLLPLLLIECKAKSLQADAENQLLGYNAFLRAPFLCLAGECEVKTFWKEAGNIKSIPFLPSYPRLLEQVSYFSRKIGKNNLL